MNMVEKMARAMCEVAKIAPDPGWRAYAPFATAVLTALSEPTPDMLAAGDGRITDLVMDDSKEIWQAMLGAALGDG